jgi:hypothetical protein
MANSDPEWEAKGIPDLLHRLDRPVDSYFAPEELLFRRFSFLKETLVAAIQFNRQNHGISFADNPDKVRLSDFRFQPHEGFEYVYDLGDNWEHDIRVEKILALDPARAYPVCILGAQP